MNHTDLCKDSDYEWRNGELFAVSDSICNDTAWIDSSIANSARCSCPLRADGSQMKEGEFPFYVIWRLESGDKIFAVDDYVVFSGGDVLCFIKPITGMH